MAKDEIEKNVLSKDQQSTRNQHQSEGDNYTGTGPLRLCELPSTGKENSFRFQGRWVAVPHQWFRYFS